MGLREGLGGSCWILLQLLVVSLAVSSNEVAAQEPIASECLKVMFAVAGVSDNHSTIYVERFQQNDIPVSTFTSASASLTLRLGGISDNTDLNRVINCFDTNHEERTTACKEFKTCSGHGTCQLSAKMHTCVCTDNYVGSLCSDHACMPSKCKNGAGCTVDAALARGFKCTCPAGYTGELCDVKIDYCEPKPCLNGGKCKSEETSYTCTCAVGYKGSTCDVKWLTEAVIARIDARLGDVFMKEQHSSRGRVYYKLYAEQVNWETAKTRCVEAGGVLASIRSASEQARAERVRLPATGEVWFGATDSAEEGTWRWSNNERVGYFNWDAPGQPDNFGGDTENHGGEDCLCLRAHNDSKWNDENCNNGRPYLCEFAE